MDDCGFNSDIIRYLAVWMFMLNRWWLSVSLRRCLLSWSSLATSLSGRVHSLRWQESRSSRLIMILAGIWPVGSASKQPGTRKGIYSSSFGDQSLPWISGDWLSYSFVLPFHQIADGGVVVLVQLISIISHSDWKKEDSKFLLWSEWNSCGIPSQ